MLPNGYGRGTEAKNKREHDAHDLLNHQVHKEFVGLLGRCRLDSALEVVMLL